MSDLQKSRAGLATQRNRQKEQTLLSTPISGEEFKRRLGEALHKNEAERNKPSGPHPLPISGAEFSRRLGIALKTGTYKKPGSETDVAPTTVDAPAAQAAAGITVGEIGSLGLTNSRKSKPRGRLATLLSGVGGPSESLGD